MELSEHQLSVVVVICGVLLLYVMRLLCNMSRPNPLRVKKCMSHHTPVLQYTPVKHVYMEGSVGPTPYKNHGVRALGKTEHVKNKTRVLWQSTPSQAKIDETTGISLNEIASESITPIRLKKTDHQVGRPRIGEVIPSHV